MIVVVGDKAAAGVAETPSCAALAGCGKLTVTGIEITALIVRDIAEIRLGELVGNLADGGEDTFSDSVVKVAAESLVGL